MILVNGSEYRTLQQKLYANGKQVLQAYCNGDLVYPEREDTEPWQEKPGYRMMWMED